MAKILVIDDDPQMRELYSEILTRAGHEVVIAENGTQGLARTEGQPELIVVDLMMPNLSGYDFVKQLRSIEGHADTPVIAASGLADGEWAVQAERPDSSQSHSEPPSSSRSSTSCSYPEADPQPEPASAALRLPSALPASTRSIHPGPLAFVPNAPSARR